jgi:hypothetical protein
MFTLNRVPTKSVKKTPYEISTGKCPRLFFLKVWGCEGHTSSLQNQTNISLWGIQEKPKDIIFIIKQMAKCLLLAVVSSWRKSFYLKELMGARCNMKTFEKHWNMFQHSLIPYRRYKMLCNQMLKPHIGLQGHVAQLKS